jgi:hypothetical protein
MDAGQRDAQISMRGVAGDGGSSCFSKTPPPLCLSGRLLTANGRRWAEARVRTLPWSVWFKNLREVLMDIMEIS